MDSKQQDVEKMLKEIKAIMHDSIRKNRYNKAMAAISAGCQILYEYNQTYVDSDFENSVIDIAKTIAQKYTDRLYGFHANRNTVLFYDGFGLDTRGISKIYLNALKKNKYKIIYVTPLHSEGHMPETQKILDGADVEWYYVNCKSSYTKWMNELLEVIFATAPKAMFFYTTPYDVSGAVAFAVMEGRVDRFLIDLTDHAFWLGVKCNDFFCGSREMSASNQVYGRGIERKKIIKLGVNLIIDESTDHRGLPFDVTEKRYVFSGGAIYKTLGDENLLFYKMVCHILGHHNDVYFLYAGDGDKKEMNKVLEMYPDRAFLIAERKDFYYLIQNCTLYLNTYPMFGGMMMRYAANAGKLPLTLKHAKDTDGILIDQQSRKIEYDSFEELVEDIDKLLTDQNYLSERERLLEGSVISEERFIKNLRSTIEEHHTDCEHSNEQIDTSKFLQEYYVRFNMDRMKTQISKRNNIPLVIDFPWMGIGLIKKAFLIMKRKLAG